MATTAGSSSLSSFRNLEEYQRSVRQAGHRVYHHLTEAQKAELKAMLRDEMHRANAAPQDAHTSASSSWTGTLEESAQRVIREKNERGEVVDANSVVEEVLPIAHSSIPAALRQKLFARIFEMTNASGIVEGIEPSK